MLKTTRKAAVLLVLAVVWGGIAAWQHHEFGHERERIQGDLIRQSEMLRQALLGGARAHRRLGRVIEEQIQAIMDEITGKSGILAVRIRDDDGWFSIDSGHTEWLASTDKSPTWLTQGLQTSERVTIQVLPRGQGQGGGGGGGPGWGHNLGEESHPLELQLTLLVDRTAADAAIQSAAHLRVIVVVASGVVLAALGLAWRALVKSMESQSQTVLLKAEKKRLEDLSQAASGLAHETRNPLGVIRAGLQTIIGNGSDGSMRDYRPRLRLMMEECDRVTSRINQFLAYARPQAAELKPVALVPLIEELQMLLQPDLEGADLELRLKVDSGCEVVQADGNLLRQILFNLLQNAIAFSPAGETVEVQVARSSGNAIRISVADVGPGVDDKLVESLFSPYSTTRQGGAGLGLAIVSRLSQEQGWTVQYQQRPEGGALFTIEGVRGAS
ncbi:sensor histidine kinase [Aeoliella mucimassa]|uniref:histidine kinase n=1 Tax=Aeoliella mucimassa TaxID=2527972 RepID=A0A518ALV8_9BACT|nr:ATP-binding protein [Aeoliella mucimassa]QDU55701.1 Sensor protein ZraS [Aeoliella mucimassa]